MEENAGVRISRKAFFQALGVIFALMILAGVLTRIVPAGQYARSVVDGREVIDPATFQYVDAPDYPVWRWFTAPFEVLAAKDGATVIAIILFILLVGMAFAVMDQSGVLRTVIAMIVKRFQGRKYRLLLVITLFFMILGGFFGIFEEVIPLVPIMILLSYSLGWDALIGLGMSILATNVGFSAAVFNPFTIGVAQKLSGLPLFSGGALRLVLFVVMFAILAFFLDRYAHKIDRSPQNSPVYAEDQEPRTRAAGFHVDDSLLDDPRQRRAIIFLAVFFLLILCVLFASPFVPLISDLALPLTGLLFVIGGIGASLIAGLGRDVWKTAGNGFLSMMPAIPLLLMAASVRYIIAFGGILDTLLHSASTYITGTGPLATALIIYALTLVVELFISSGSAKAFLLIPILMPLADLVGVNRQIAVSAYCFGDGFSNLAYPTNAALLITLSLTVVPYSKWLRWILGLWVWVLLATVAFLALAVAINYGPF